jgi:hypothetical protein
MPDGCCRYEAIKDKEVPMLQSAMQRFTLPMVYNKLSLTRNLQFRGVNTH